VLQDFARPRPTVDVVAQGHEPFFALEAQTIGGDLRLEIEELVQTAVHVADRVNRGRPAMEDETWMGHWSNCCALKVS
jgi:hypothetical protein